MNMDKMMSRAAKAAREAAQRGKHGPSDHHHGGGRKHGGRYSGSSGGSYHGGGERPPGSGGDRRSAHAGGGQSRQILYCPIPTKLHAQRNSITNFGMLFQKFAQYGQPPGRHGPTVPLDIVENFPTVLTNEKLAGQYDRVAGSNAAKSSLSEQQNRMKAVNRAMNGKELSATLVSPLVTGTGNAHAGEVGMTFDRNTGLPYIPSSSIKGTVRMAYCVELYHRLKNNPDALNKAFDQHAQRKDRGKVKDIGLSIRDEEEGLVRFFGDPDPSKKGSRRGQVVFMDAFAQGIPSVKLDIMNPHFTGYYQGRNGPVETENPVPIKFLTVAPGARFVFRWHVKYLPGADRVGEEQMEIFEAALRKALTEHGLGAKTSIGYGRFAVDT